MKIELKKITVSELSKGYQDNAEAGVVGFGGKLDIRPPFQREFVYKDKQRDAVINTVTKDFPLNVMYWSVRDDGSRPYKTLARRRTNYSKKLPDAL
jgi:hypothetical protein